MDVRAGHYLYLFDTTYRVLAIVAGKGTPGVGPGDPSFGGALEVFSGNKIDSLHSILAGDQNR